MNIFIKILCLIRICNKCWGTSKLRPHKFMAITHSCQAVSLVMQTSRSANSMMPRPIHKLIDGFTGTQIFMDNRIWKSWLGGRYCQYIHILHGFVHTATFSRNSNEMKMFAEYFLDYASLNEEKWGDVKIFKMPKFHKSLWIVGINSHHLFYLIMSQSLYKVIEQLSSNSNSS